MRNLWAGFSDLNFGKKVRAFNGSLWAVSALREFRINRGIRNFHKILSFVTCTITGSNKNIVCTKAAKIVYALRIVNFMKYCRRPVPQTCQ